MIYVMLAQGFEEIEALAFTDILRRANIDVKTVSVSDSDAETGAHGIKVVTDINISDTDVSDMEAIVLPGGLPGAYNLRDSIYVKKLLDYAVENNITIGAICASPCVVLNAHKYLDGKCATVYPGFESEMTNVTITDENVVCDGNFITSKGPGTTHEFAKTFVHKFADDATADKVIAGMLYN